MRSNRRTLAGSLMVGAAILIATPAAALAQGNTKRASADVAVTASVTLTKAMQADIRDFYAHRAPTGAQALPPGIRRRLARGKPLPPGIAKRFAPDGLRSRLHLPDGYALMEVGFDVLLVEVATNVIHDKLMDVIR
ncbi:MAG: anti-virulence regulator CigR family protein [Gemmatimonadales bacterium]|jgi:hypothetical protein